MIFSLLILSTSTIANEIFVWQKDNGLRFPDPVFDEELTIFESITRTLDELEIEYDNYHLLPDDPGQYDVIIIPVGFFCNT